MQSQSEQLMSDMRWYYLKVGKGNSLAVEWLAGKNPLQRPAVLILYGRCSIADIKAGRRGQQEKDFYESSLPENQNARVITVVGGGYVWFLKPAAVLEEHDPSVDGSESNDTYKMMPVDLILPQPLRLAAVPPVLAGINANAYLSRGTYREITSWGNIKAIQSALGRALPPEHLEQENCSSRHLLECLSSVELETLVAKLFEAAGCFVPAYRGGCIQDVDLFGHNDGKKPVEIGRLTVQPGQHLAIQVKGKAGHNKCPEAVDCFIALDAPNRPDCYDADWLLSEVKKHPSVLAWLKRSLVWLPAEFLSRYEL
jgi:hypothetical protein